MPLAAIPNLTILLLTRVVVPPPNCIPTTEAVAPEEGDKLWIKFFSITFAEFVPPL